MSTTTEYRPSIADRIGILIFMVAGALLVIWAGFAAVMRVIEVLLGERIPVQVEFIGLDAELPIGPGGADVPVEVESATLAVPQLSSVGLFVGAAQPIVYFLTVAVIVVCMLLLSSGSLRGRIFSRRNTVLVTTAGMTALVGLVVSNLFGTMLANDALARISEGDFVGSAASYSPFPYVLGAFAFGIVATAYTVGARIQRDAEGLV